MKGYGRIKKRMPSLFVNEWAQKRYCLLLTVAEKLAISNAQQQFSIFRMIASLGVVFVVIVIIHPPSPQPSPRHHCRCCCRWTPPWHPLQAHCSPQRSAVSHLIDGGGQQKSRKMHCRIFVRSSGVSPLPSSSPPSS